MHAMESSVVDASCWSAVSFEERPWLRDPDHLASIPKSRRRAIAPTYRCALPLRIAERSVAIPHDVQMRLSDIEVALARFDAEQKFRGYDLPALLLRSESSASSQIEHLTSSVRNVALAEVSDGGPHNARLIAGNVAAMRVALSAVKDLSIEEILGIHRALMAPSGMKGAGTLRDEQVWVGGTSYSPHGALFVPPAADRVSDCLSDMVLYAHRGDVHPVVKAAIVHAQFETIHPFVDGNGRTGRALVHVILRQEGLLQNATLPVSSGLLHCVEDYMESIRCYQEGDPVAVIERLIDALEIALSLGMAAVSSVDRVIGEWTERITERSGSSIWRLPGLLVSQPVVDVRYVAEHLSITPRAASTLVQRAVTYGMLRPIGLARRGDFYQADDLLDVLEEIASAQAVRRVMGRAAR